MQSARTHAVSPGESFASSPLFKEGQSMEKVQGHWVLARAGKRVLRPGGIELTRSMLNALAIGPQDRIVEFAPGLGVTARLVLQRQPMSYCGLERDPVAAERLRKELAGTGAQITFAQAERSGLPSSSATVVYGEAFLSMQTQEQKNRILAEACRLLVPGGRYGIHELCFLPDDVSDATCREIQVAMAKVIHGGIQPLSRREWITWLERNGLKVIWSREVPMQLLEPRRVLRDEGVAGALRFAFNLAVNPMLRHRALAMRRLFRRYAEHLRAISLVAELERKNA